MSKTTQIGAPVTQEFKVMAHEAAHRHGISLAAYMRMAVVHLIEQGTIPFERRDVMASRPVRPHEIKAQ